MEGLQGFRKELDLGYYCKKDTGVPCTRGRFSEQGNAYHFNIEALPAIVAISRPDEKKHAESQAVRKSTK